jgi:hypothetical protein
VCLQYVETDLQKMQMKLKTEPRGMHEAIETEYAAAARAKPVRRPPDLDKSGALTKGFARCINANVLLDRQCFQGREASPVLLMLHTNRNGSVLQQGPLTCHSKPIVCLQGRGTA